MQPKSRSFVIHDITKVYSKLYSDGTESSNRLIIKAVMEATSILIAQCSIGDKVKIPSIGTFEIRPPKKMTGTFTNHRTKKQISKVSLYPRIRFIPSPGLKLLLRSKWKTT